MISFSQSITIVINIAKHRILLIEYIQKSSNSQNRLPILPISKLVSSISLLNKSPVIHTVAVIGIMDNIHDSALVQIIDVD